MNLILEEASPVSLIQPKKKGTKSYLLVSSNRKHISCYGEKPLKPFALNFPLLERLFIQTHRR